MNTELETSLKKIREEFIPAAEKLFGEALKSIILYGSAARGSYIHGSSDINILIVIEEPDPEKIISLGSEQAKLIKKHRLSLHILSEGEFIRSSDIFPMEYLDVQEEGSLLYGDNVAEKLDITKRNLRHQVEERLRGNINAMRQALIASRGNSRLLSQLLRENIGTLIAPLRGLLRLSSSELPTGELEVLKRVNEEFGVDGGPVKEILSLREGGRTDAKRLAVDLIGFLTGLVRKVDELEVE